MDIKKRSEVAIGDTWDLLPLFFDEKAWEKGMKELQKEVDREIGRASCRERV